MDIRKLKQEYPVLLDYMKQQGYGKVSIGGVQVRLKELLNKKVTMRLMAIFMKSF